MKTFINTRVVKAVTFAQAVVKISEGEFEEDNNFSDAILTRGELCKRLLANMSPNEQQKMSDYLYQLNLTVPKEYKKESIKWSVLDIISRAEELEIKISRKDAKKVLRQVIEGHDCNYGITWETFDSYLNELKKQP